jgi:DNA primase
MTDTRIPQSFIRELVDRTDIVDIVRTRIELKKKGQNHHGRCPFHEEKTPSFTVSENKQFYYCFGCGAHGNAVDFLMNYDRMEFREVIDYLAAQQGIDVPKVEGYVPDRAYDALFPVMQKVATFYYQQLKHTPQAIDYLKSRSLTGQTAKLFSIGYAPSGWNNLTQALGNDAKLYSYLTTTGMCIDRDRDSIYDRFRNRIMFPIHDLRGRIIAFGGRTMGDEQPKYLNSPETDIFHKSKELYGLYQARQANQKLKRLLIVEGYMDVVSLYQHGITYSVATLGTAINIKHLQKALRFTTELVFCFDGDNAGRKAAWKALTIAMPSLRDGISLKFLFLPEGEDPDSLVQKIGKDAFEKLIKQASSLQHVFFDSLKLQYPENSLADKAALALEAKKYIAQMPTGLYQELLYDELAKRINVTRNELEQVAAPKQRHQPAKPTTPQVPTMDNAPLTLHCIALLLQEPSFAKEVTDLQFLEESNKKTDQLLYKLIHIFKQHPELPVGQLLTHWEQPDEQALIAQLAAKEHAFPSSGFKSEFEDTIKSLQQKHLQQQVNTLITKSKSGELSPDEKKQLNKLLINKSRQNAHT